MLILAIDTSTENGGAALGRAGETIGLAMLKAPLRYSERVLYLVDFLLQQHELEVSQVDCFAVATGPGSFTGLRIGLATVKAFCQGLAKPAVGVSTLEALAFRFRHIHPRIATMMDARRGQIFGAVYRIDGWDLQAEVDEQVMEPEAWLKDVPGQECLFVGDGAAKYRKTIQAVYGDAHVMVTDNRILDELLELGWARFKEGKTFTAEELAANYVRPSDAELGRAARAEDRE